MDLPVRITQDLTPQRVNTEIVFFDAVSGRATCLNRITAVIWEFCDGSRSTANIAQAATLEMQTPVSIAVVDFAVKELRAKGLVHKLDLPDAPAATVLSRRAMMQSLGMRAALLLPIVGSVQARNITLPSRQP